MAFQTATATAPKMAGETASRTVVKKASMMACLLSLLVEVGSKDGSSSGSVEGIDEGSSGGLAWRDLSSCCSTRHLHCQRATRGGVRRCKSNAMEREGRKNVGNDNDKNNKTEVVGISFTLELLRRL
jgi:hypothetical protein